MKTMGNKQKSNIKFIKDYMDLGPVNQLMVMFILSDHMKMVAKGEAEYTVILESHLPGGIFISQESMVNAAKTFMTMFNKHCQQTI